MSLRKLNIISLHEPLMVHCRPKRHPGNFNVELAFLGTSALSFENEEQIASFFLPESCFYVWIDYFVHTLNVLSGTFFYSHCILNTRCGRRGGLMVSALVSGASGLGSSPGQERFTHTLTAVKRKRMRNALVPRRRPRKFPRQNLTETIAEPVLRE